MGGCTNSLKAVPWFDQKNLFLRPDLLQKLPPRAAAVKDLPRVSAARSVLDRREHGGRIQPVRGFTPKAKLMVATGLMEFQ